MSEPPELARIDLLFDNEKMINLISERGDAILSGNKEKQK